VLQSRSKLDRLSWSFQQLMKMDAMNIVILVISVLIIWSIISNNIDNPARYLPSPLAVAFSSVDMLVKGLLPSYLYYWILSTRL
jgi:ABC-type nitrate/sulfonate/bicarbonate transport system permease component